MQWIAHLMTSSWSFRLRSGDYQSLLIAHSRRSHQPPATRKICQRLPSYRWFLRRRCSVLRFSGSGLRASSDGCTIEIGESRKSSVRLLWVKAGKLLPVDTGGKIRSYNILRRLSNQHGVTLLSYCPGQGDPAYEAALPEEFPGAEVLCTGTVDSEGFQGVLDYLYRLPRPAPYSVTKYTPPKVRKAVAEHLSSGKVDVAICDFLAASLNFPEELPIPCVLFQHNVESSLWQRMAATATHPLRQLSSASAAARMSRSARRTRAKFHPIVAVSDHGRRQMLEMDPG